MKNETCECGRQLSSEKTRDDPLGQYLYCKNRSCPLFGKKQVYSDLMGENKILNDER